MAAIKPYILGIEGLALSPFERARFAEMPPFGVILFLRNIDNPAQLARLIDEIKSISNGETLMFIDQEGGRVQRLAPPHWRQFPSVAHYAERDDAAFETAVYAHHRLIGEQVRMSGFDVNFAPTLDLRSMMTALFLHDRVFGYDATRVKLAGKAAFRGLRDAGVIGCMKHIPGHGRARVDSHKELPHVAFASDPYATPLPEDVEVFTGDFGADMAMSAHILYTQIDADNPLTLSPKGVDYVRRIIGFDGLMITDDLDMKALAGHQGELARRAITAGIDVAMACSGHAHHIAEVYEADLTPNDRLLAHHARYREFLKKPPQPLDDARRRELQAAIGLG